MTGAPATEMAFQTSVVVDREGRTHLTLPFDPDEIWGSRPRHHVTGSAGGIGLRGTAPGGSGSELVLGPAWAPGALSAGDLVEVVLRPEGPQRADLDPDLAEAFDANPEAAAFFDGLAQFYRKQYLTWIAGARRRPEVRAERVTELMTLLEGGNKQRSR